MKKLKYIEIREKFLEYMRGYGHVEIPNTSLILENDPTLLFTSAGMVPLIPYLTGEKHPSGRKLVNVQRCIRTVDIEEVGDFNHCTSFEMLGYWSLNDYFKNKSIDITIGFLLTVLDINIDKIYVSVFGGDGDAPTDKVSIKAWKRVFKKYGINAKVGKNERIQPFDKSENWWGLESGGPCGPDSEIFYDTGKKPCSPTCNVSCDCGKYNELCNNVFMEYLLEDGVYKPLGRHNVDFGAGLDRLAMLSQGVESIYDTDIYKPIVDTVEKLVTHNKKVDGHLGTTEKSIRVIVDHIKAATWIIMDGVKPGRTEQAYILRRLIRRAIRHGKSLNLGQGFLEPVAKSAIKQFGNIYPQLTQKETQIISIIDEEEKNFNKTLQTGLKEVNKVIHTLGTGTTFANHHGVSFYLYETYGFPSEMFIEELASNAIPIDIDAFWKEHKNAFKKHQEKSRTAAKGLFKGGLADTSDQSMKLHTATHLLLSALQQIIDKKIYQQGSNITPERLRLDFPLKRKLTKKELDDIQNLVNQAIQNKLPITFVEMKKESALKLVPTAAFAENYPDIVKVYYIGDPSNPFSVEVCRGPHVKNTSELGKFTIVKHESTGAETKRIKAILE